MKSWITKTALTLAATAAMTGVGLAVAAQPASASYSTCTALKSRMDRLLSDYIAAVGANDPQRAAEIFVAYEFHMALYNANC